jgi:mono/diheme cytochrome c family protein
MQRFILSILLSLTALTAVADDQKPLGVVGSRVVAMDGKVHQMGMDGSVLKPMVISFIDPQCSADAAVIESLRQLNAKALAKKHVFYAVVPGGTANWSQTNAFINSNKLPFPVILDADRNLQHRLAPGTALETIVISKHDALLQRSKLGKASVAAVDYPKTALDADAYCTIAEGTDIEKPDYNRHIASLLQANCVDCHRPKGIGPFALGTFEESRPMAHIMALVTKQRIMPPWKARPGSGHYLNERLLSEHQIDLLARWAETGANEGAPADATPAANLNTSEWPLGEPDIIISMDEAFRVPAGGPDIYRYFVVKDAIPKGLEIAAIDFLPGDASVVHHANFFVDYGKKARAKDAEDPAPGFSVFGTGGFFSYWDSNNTAAGLGAWAPGGNAIRYPDGLGIKLPGGADFIFEIHYHPTGKAANDQSRLGIYLAKKPIKKTLTSLFVGTNQMSIPAGAKDYKRYFYMDLPTDMSIVDIGPHMHYLGTRAQVSATLPDGTEKSLLDVDWDFRWQGAYFYREPLFLPKGTRIHVTTSYDNSADNPYNPYNPPVVADWGWGTDQEMGELYVTAIANSASDSRKLQEAARQSWLRPSDPEVLASNLSDAEIIERLKHLSTWEKDGESLALLLLGDNERAERSLALVKKLRRQSPKDARLLMVAGSLNAIVGSYSQSSREQYRYYSDAMALYEAALALDETLWDARYGLATGYATDTSAASLKIAESHFLKLLQQQESTTATSSRFVLPYTGLGDMYRQQGRDEDARRIWQRGVKHFPRNQHLVERLGLDKKTGR